MPCHWDLDASEGEISRLKAELDVSRATNIRMAQDISEFQLARYSSEASLKKTNDDLGFSAERCSALETRNRRSRYTIFDSFEQTNNSLDIIGGRYNTIIVSFVV